MERGMYATSALTIINPSSNTLTAEEWVIGDTFFSNPWHFKHNVVLLSHPLPPGARFNNTAFVRQILLKPGIDLQWSHDDWRVCPLSYVETQMDPNLHPACHSLSKVTSDHPNADDHTRNQFFCPDNECSFQGLWGSRDIASVMEIIPNLITSLPLEGIERIFPCADNFRWDEAGREMSIFNWDAITEDSDVDYALTLAVMESNDIRRALEAEAGAASPQSSM